jgi:hypothetical protein
MVNIIIPPPVIIADYEIKEAGKSCLKKRTSPVPGRKPGAEEALLAYLLLYLLGE